MKQLFLIKMQADRACNDHHGNYVLSSCDVDQLDCGNCAVADNILASAMGEVSCYRDAITNEILAAWWQDDDVYEGEVLGRHTKVYFQPDGDAYIDGLDDMDEEEAQKLIEQF